MSRTCRERTPPGTIYQQPLRAKSPHPSLPGACALSHVGGRGRRRRTPSVDWGIVSEGLRGGRAAASAGPAVLASDPPIFVRFSWRFHGRAGGWGVGHPWTSLIRRVGLQRRSSIASGCRARWRCGGHHDGVVAADVGDDEQQIDARDHHSQPPAPAGRSCRRANKPSSYPACAAARTNRQRDDADRR